MRCGKIETVIEIDRDSVQTYVCIGGAYYVKLLLEFMVEGPHLKSDTSFGLVFATALPEKPFQRNF